MNEWTSWPLYNHLSFNLQFFLILILLERANLASKFYQFSSVMSDSLLTPWTAARQASPSFTISRSLLKLLSIESMPSNHLILCRPLLLPSILPASGSFPMSQLFTSGGQSTGALASASVLPMNQGWFPLRLTGLISFESKWLSRVFSSTTIWKHRFFSTQPSLWSSSHIHTWLLEKP